ncbi:hypothetical protein Tco_0532268 [Tanacetum coccineum]
MAKGLQSKKTVQNDEDRRCMAWVVEEEIILCKDDEEEDMIEVQQPMSKDKAKKKASTSSASSASGNEEALARVMVNEHVYLTAPYKERKSHNVKEFLEIRREQELKMREMEQHRQDETFYLQPIDHLTRA